MLPALTGNYGFVKVSYMFCGLLCSRQCNQNGSG